ncbi:MAG: hypothetical protein AAGL89_00845 [Pseudomonadota bacterium]
MIGHVDHILMPLNDPDWPKVTGWTNIPTDPNDADWPEPLMPILQKPDEWPPQFEQDFNGMIWARSDETREEMHEMEALLRNPAVLSRPEVTLDVLGHQLETTVHNWMHMRFAGMPSEIQFDERPSNDYLGDPFSSHVNPYFWKLHGWIDDCIGHWEAAKGQTADLSGAWQAPDEAPSITELLAEPAAELRAVRMQHFEVDAASVQAIRSVAHQPDIR